MDAISRALADPAVRGLYVAACFVMTIVPAAAVAWWYHSRIRATPGGRRLMTIQDFWYVRGGYDRRGRRNDVRATGLIIDGLQRGAFGPQAARRTRQAVTAFGLWAAVLAVMFGVLIWADEVNRGAG
jgi:hypothetical protein